MERGRCCKDSSSWAVTPFTHAPCEKCLPLSQPWPLQQALTCGHTDPKGKSSQGLLSQMTTLSWSYHKSWCHLQCREGVLEPQQKEPVWDGCVWGNKMWVPHKGRLLARGPCPSHGSSECKHKAWRRALEMAVLVSSHIPFFRGNCVRKWGAATGSGVGSPCRLWPEQRQTSFWQKEKRNVELHLHQLLILLLEAYYFFFFETLDENASA